MAKRPKSKIQRGFVLGYMAIAVMVVATGFALRNFPSISADTTSTATPTAAASSVFTWKGCVDGTADIQFGADPTDVAVKVLGYTYKAIGTHSNCASKFQDTAPAGTTTGSLTNCATITLGDSNSTHVKITNDTSIALRKVQGDSALLQPFKVHIADNGTGPFDYQFSLICTKSAIVPSPTPTPVASPAPSVTTTASATDAYTVTLKHGFNTIIVPSDDVTAETADSLALDTSPITDNGMFLYDFNRLGQKNWRTTNPAAGALFGNIDRMVSNIGYYVYNPGNSQTLSLPFISTGQTVTNEEKIKVRRGWNLIASASSTGRSLSTDYGINVLQPDASNDCVADDCFAYVSLRDLFAGDASTNRAYGTIYEIKDGTATTADAAFTVVKINSTNLDTITIPPKTPFWIYLWN